MQNRRSPYNSIGLRQQPHGYSGYQGYGGQNAAPKPVQSVAEILSEPLGDVPPDLRGASGTASRQREIADMLTGRVMSKQATGIADGLAQLGEAWIARKANKKADAADSKRDEIISMLTQKAAAGDEASIAQLLSPEAMIGRKDTQARQGIEDARYTDERDYSRGRDQVADTRYTQQWDYSVGRDEIADTRYVDERDYGRTRDQMSDAERRAANAPRDTWQSAGDGYIFNNRTGETKSAGGAVAGPGGVDPRQVDNDFFRSQGIEAQLTQFATGDGGVGINQQGVYDDTRPDDANGPNSDSYNTYRARTRGAGDTKRIATIRENTATAVNDLDILLNEAQTLIEEGVPSGVMAKTRTDLGRFNSGLKATTGLDLSGLPFVPNETETAQMGAMQSVQTQLALLRTQLTKGAISNYEMEMFIQSVPGLSNTPEGNQLILKNMRNMQARAIAYGEAADTWDQMFGGVSAANPKTGQSFDQAWAEYTRNNPVFDLRGAPIEADPTSGRTGTGAKGGVRSGAAGGRGAAPVQIQDDAQYDALPSGAEFIGPDGVRRRKP